MRTTLFLLAAITLVSCQPTKEAPSPSPKVIPDTELIPQMCQHIGPKDKGGLGCEEGNPVYNSDIAGPPGVPNQSCADYYKELQDRGFFVNPRCILQVPSCSQIEPARQKTCN